MAKRGITRSSGLSLNAAWNSMRPPYTSTGTNAGAGAVECSLGLPTARNSDTIVKLTAIQPAKPHRVSPNQSPSVSFMIQAFSW